jgi:hypothetical protein
MKMLLRLPSQLGRLSVIVPSVVAAKRWEINRVNLARRSGQCEVTAQQQVIDGMLQSFVSCEKFRSNKLI